jgi:hypothetical protein
VFLVGGFAASDWLFTKLKEDLTTYALVVTRPDSHAYASTTFRMSAFCGRNKAVADGAASFSVSKLAFGIDHIDNYDVTNPKHASRKHIAPSVMIRVHFTTTLLAVALFARMYTRYACGLQKGDFPVSYPKRFLAW